MPLRKEPHQEPSIRVADQHEGSCDIESIEQRAKVRQHTLDIKDSPMRIAPAQSGAIVSHAGRERGNLGPDSDPIHRTCRDPSLEYYDGSVLTVYPRMES